MTLRASIQSGLLNQSAAQIVDGSLKFDGSKSQYLKRTPSSAGNRRKWTWSAWLKRDRFADDSTYHIFFSTRTSNTNRHYIAYNADVSDQLFSYDHTNSNNKIAQTNASYRDTGWYHVVVIYDTANGDGGERLKVFINGVENDDWGSYQTNGENFEGLINSVTEHRIGGEPNASDYFYGSMSQCYFIDGQALGPSYFGFTDALTGTWRSKLLKDGDQATPNTHLLYNVNTSDNGFDSSSTSRTYDVTSREFSTYTTPQTANPGGYGANSAHVYKSPTGYAITWIVSTSTSDRYIWTSEDGVNWKSKGSFYDTDGSSQSITSTYIALAGGSNSSNVTVTSETVDFGTNGFHLPMDGNSPIGQDKSGKGNDWTPVNFVGFNSVDKATGALPILEGPGGIIANVATRTDENASSLALALPLVGSANDVSNRIKGSGSAKTITVNGNAHASSDQSNFYGGSFEFDGTGDYLTVTNDTDLVFGTGAFTIECWIYAETYNSVTYPTVISKYDDGDASWILRLKSDGDIVWYDGNNNESTTQPISLNEWIHLAVVREGTGSNQTKVYVNGVLHLTHTDSSNYDDTNNIYIGRQDASNTNEFDGYIQDVRIYKGVAKYTSNFVPASTNPDILPDTPSGVSGSSKLTKITEGAVSFGSKGLDNIDVGESSDFGFGTGDWTVEGYFYVSESGSNRVLWDLRPDSDYYFLRLNGTATYRFQYGSSVVDFDAADNRWNHIAISRSSGTTKIFVNGIETNSFSDSTNNSTGTLRLSTFRDTTTSSSDYGFEGQLSNFRIVKGTALYTSNFTPPTEPLTNVTNTKLLCCQSNTSANLAAVSPATFSNSGDVYSSGISGSQDNTNGGGSAAAFDGQLGNEDEYGSYPNAGQTLTWTAANSDLGTTLAYSSTIRVYVNVDTNGDDGGLTVVGNNGSQTIDAGSAGGRWVDISAATSPITSIAWSRASSGSQGVTLVAVEVDGSLLIDGFYGKAIPRAGNVSATNFNPFNTDINTVRGQETGYATLNPLSKGSAITLTNGNLDISAASSGSQRVWGSIGVSTGKWYFEFTQSSGTYAQAAGIKSSAAQDNSTQYGYHGNTGNKIDASGSTSSYGATWGNNDTVGVAFDLDAGTITFYKNGVSQGQAFSGITDATYFPYVFGWSGGTWGGFVNFGQKPFKFPPPEGFQPLNGANIRPETVIANPTQYVEVTTYTGNNSDRFIDVGFKPDLSYFARRNTAGYIKYFFDSVRGATKTLATSGSQGDDAEGTATDGLKSFDPSGVTIGNNAQMNENNGLYVSWHWKAGGNKNTFNVDDVGYASAAAAGLSGDITPTGASVGTRQGFSIIKYTGNGNNSAQSIPHGLGKTPTFIMTKALEATGDVMDWRCYHQTLGNTKYIALNSTAAAGTFYDWGNTSPTNQYFYVGGFSGTQPANESKNYIAYVWSDVPGLQKFGNYLSQGGNDANYVHLGFRPAILWIKSANHVADTTSWCIFTDEIDKTNPFHNPLYANNNGEEGKRGNNSNSGTFDIDLLSDGFKIRTNVGEINEGGSGNYYLYCAWAEAPAVNLYGGQSNAR